MEAKRTFCTFSLNHFWFGLAVEKVQEVAVSPALTPVPLAPRAVAGLTNLRGRIVTVMDLWRRLGFEERPVVTLPAMVVVGNENASVGLLVDQIGDVVEAPENTCEPAPGNLPAELQELVPMVCKFPQRLLHILDLDRVLRH